MTRDCTRDRYADMGAHALRRRGIRDCFLCISSCPLLCIDFYCALLSPSPGSDITAQPELEGSLSPSLVIAAETLIAVSWLHEWKRNYQLLMSTLEPGLKSCVCCCWARGRKNKKPDMRRGRRFRQRVNPITKLFTPTVQDLFMNPFWERLYSVNA